MFSSCRAKLQRIAAQRRDAFTVCLHVVDTILMCVSCGFFGPQVDGEFAAMAGRGRGVAAFTFNIEALGISRGSMPETRVGPNPLFPVSDELSLSLSLPPGIK